MVNANKYNIPIIKIIIYTTILLNLFLYYNFVLVQIATHP